MALFVCADPQQTKYNFECPLKLRRKDKCAVLFFRKLSWARHRVYYVCGGPSHSSITFTVFWDFEEKQKEGQDIYQNGKEAKQTKSDYTQWQGKLENQRAKLQEAEEEADKDNDSEKAKRVAKMKKHVKNSIAMAEQAGELHDQIMKGTRTLTGVKMTDDALNESLRHLVSVSSLFMHHITYNILL